MHRRTIGSSLRIPNRIDYLISDLKIGETLKNNNVLPRSLAAFGTKAMVSSSGLGRKLDARRPDLDHRSYATRRCRCLMPGSFPLLAIATHVCYTESMSSVTSSFRMSKELQRVLSDAAERTGKGKNAIIIEALVKYLKSMERESLAGEARRQSELVSRNEQDADWYGMADTSGWR